MLKNATLKARKINEKLAPLSVVTPPLVSTDVVAEAEDDTLEVKEVVALFEVEVPTLEFPL